MSTSTTPTASRVWTRLAVVATALVAACSFLGGSVIAGDGGGQASNDRPVDHVVVVGDPETPIWIQAREQRRLCEAAALMPSYWPAAEVMRRQAEQPLGTAAQRAQWRRDAERLPSHWPAAQVMLADADGHRSCAA